MKDQTVPVLIVALVVAFGIGFMVGHASAPQPSPLPLNYNPVAAMESQGIKAAQENAKLCFDLIASHLDTIKVKETPPAH